MGSRLQRSYEFMRIIRSERRHTSPHPLQLIKKIHFFFFILRFYRLRPFGGCCYFAWHAYIYQGTIEQMQRRKLSENELPTHAFRPTDTERKGKEIIKYIICSRAIIIKTGKTKRQKTKWHRMEEKFK